MQISRREYLTLSAAATGAMAAGLATDATAQSAVNEVKCFGGSGGGPFGPIFPTSVGLAQGRDRDNAVRVNFIRINGVEYGSRRVDDGQLQERTELRFASDEYLTSARVRWGHKRPIFDDDRPELIDMLDLTTNKGNRTRTTGWSEFSKEDRFDSVRVCTIAGRYGSRLDRICFEVIRNYQPSEKVLENEPAVFEYHAPGSTLTEATTEENKRVTAWERVVTRQKTRSFSASVGVELLAGLVGLSGTFSGALTNQVTTVSTVSGALEQKVTTFSQTERTTGDFEGFVVGRVDVFLDQEGNYYAVPTTGGTFARYRREDLVLLHRAINFAPGVELAPVNVRSIPDPLLGGALERLIVT